MKRYLAPTFICLALAVHGLAREPQAPPSPTGPPSRANYSVTRDEKEPENVFVGHYGEILRLYTDWTAEAIMRGPVEVVYFREKTSPPVTQWPSEVKLDGPDATVTFHPPPFQIKPEEYLPENMARLRLMQLLVVPKDIPEGFRTLKKLREAKSKELGAIGNPYKLREVGDYPWPPDSFWVSISTPYRLFQFYTQSDKNFFIFTSGASPYDDKHDDPILASATSRLLSSLSTHLDDYGRKLRADKSLIYDLRIALLPWAAVCALATFLNFLPQHRPWLGRLRLIGRMTFGLTTGSLLFAVPVLFASWRVGLDRAINEASILLFTSLILPWICKTISIRLDGQHPWRVFAWSAATNIFPVVVGLTIVGDFIAGTTVISGYQDFWMLSVLLSVLGLLNGVAFGLTHTANEKGLHGWES